MLTTELFSLPYWLSCPALKIGKILCNLLNAAVFMFHEIPTQVFEIKTPRFFVISGGLGVLLIHKIVRALLRVLQRCNVSGLKCLSRRKAAKL